jgi:ankyrin repeat protein
MKKLTNLFNRINPTKSRILLLCISTLSTTLQGAEATARMSDDYLRALRSGDVRQVRTLLDKGASPNARDAAGNTPLMLVAVYGDAQTVRLLLDRGAEVNVTNAAGATPLLRAAHNLEKTRALVAAGAEVNIRSALGNTPLMLAARPANSHRAVQLLLDRGADARATNFFGGNALMAAAAGGDARSVQLLLEHGVNPNAQPGTAPPDFLFGGGRSALMWAAFRGDTAIMNLLLGAGADPNAEGMLGTPLNQAAWADRTDAAKLLLAHGAKVNQADHSAGYTPLHWAASTEERDASLVKLLLDHGANPNAEGGQNVDAFMDVAQTPLMLAQRRGSTPVVDTLAAAGATNGTPDKVRLLTPRKRDLPARLDSATLRSAIEAAIPPLQVTSIESKKSFANHASKQDCVSCHQQFLPLGAMGAAKRAQVSVDRDSEAELLAMIQAGELKNPEPDWEALFHPDAAQTKGYSMFGQALDNVPSNEYTESSVHHLAVIQGTDGRWYNNLPRPPLQSSDVGATALAIHALQKYPLPGRKAEFAKRVERARKWLWTVTPETTEARVYQLLGLAWAGESAQKLQPLAKALIAEQRPDGGWAQLPGTKSDAYATGQAVHALRTAAGLNSSEPAVDYGRRFLLKTQLADGTWYVHRRAFPFQPTMNSGFPHGKDSWISAAATSWAVIALSEPDEDSAVARK